jgi:hypothetical protein
MYPSLRWVPHEYERCGHEAQAIAVTENLWGKNAIAGISSGRPTHAGFEDCTPLLSA